MLTRQIQPQILNSRGLIIWILEKLISMHLQGLKNISVLFMR